MRGFRYLLLALLVSGCVQTTAAMLDERTAIVSGRGGIQHSGADVLQAVLRGAASEAEARGFSYFQVIDSRDSSRSAVLISPTMISSHAQLGTDMIIRMYRDGEIDPSAPGVWSVQSILAQR